MSIKSILEKLSIEEIKELSNRMQEHQVSFFGNKLRESKQQAFISKILGQKNWNSLVAAKTKKEEFLYCPNCGMSTDLHYCADARALYKIKTDGEINDEYHDVTLFDDGHTECFNCGITWDSISSLELQDDAFSTWEVVLKGYNGENDKTDHLVKWVNVNVSMESQFKKHLSLLKTVKSFSNLNESYSQKDGVDYSFPSYQFAREVK